MTVATLIDKRASRIVPVLLAAAVSSLVTSWALKTPELARKAQHLEVVEQKEIPHLKDVAGCQTARARKATSLAKDSEKGRDIDLRDIPNCPALNAAPPQVSVIVPKLPS